MENRSQLLWFQPFYMFTIQIIGEGGHAVTWVACEKSFTKVSIIEVREFLHELDHWVKVVKVTLNMLEEG